MLRGYIFSIVFGYRELRASFQAYHGFVGKELDDPDARFDKVVEQTRHFIEANLAHVGNRVETEQNLSTKKAGMYTA